MEGEHSTTRSLEDENVLTSYSLTTYESRVLEKPILQGVVPPLILPRRTFAPFRLLFLNLLPVKLLVPQGVQVLRNMYNIPSGNMWWGNEFNKTDGPVKITTKRKNNILCKKQTCSIKWFISTYNHNYDV